MNYILLNLLVVAIIVSVIRLTNSYVTHIKRDDDVKEHRLLMSFEYKEDKNKINSFLNSFLSDCMQDYIMNNIMTKVGLEFIKSDMEIQIREDMVDLVSARISPMIRKKISMYYNDSYFGTLLAEKIYVMVTLYVSDFNEDKKENINNGKTKKAARSKVEEIDPEHDW